MTHAPILFGLQALCALSRETKLARLAQYLLKRGSQLARSAACQMAVTDRGIVYKVLPMIEMWHILLVTYRIPIRRFKFWQHAAMRRELRSVLILVVSLQNFRWESGPSLDEVGRRATHVYPWFMVPARDVPAM